MPLFIRKFIVDFVETTIAAVFLLNIVLPSDVTQVKQVGVVIGLAVVSALVSAVRRTTPDFLGWFRIKLGVS